METAVAFANKIFRDQFNIILRIKYAVVVADKKDPTNQVESFLGEAPLHENCTPQMEEKLSKFQAYIRTVATSSLFDEEEYEDNYSGTSGEIVSCSSQLKKDYFLLKKG